MVDRQMTVKFNGKESSKFPLVGGGPQGSWTGQECYLVARDDNADCVGEEDQYKYSDDLSILELIMLADILTEYVSMWRLMLGWTNFSYLPKGWKLKQI